MPAHQMNRRDAKSSAAAVLALALALGLSPARAAAQHVHSHESEEAHASEAEDSAASRQEAARRVEWRRAGYAGSAAAQPDKTVRVKLLGINDFHGQLSAGKFVGNRPVGGAAVLAAYLEAAQNDPNDPGLADRTFLVHAGDHVGASPPASALLQDEPSIAANLHMKGASAEKVFGELRERKNKS